MYNLIENFISNELITNQRILTSMEEITFEFEEKYGIIENQTDFLNIFQSIILNNESTFLPYFIKYIETLYFEDSDKFNSIILSNNGDDLDSLEIIIAVAETVTEYNDVLLNNEGMLTEVYMNLLLNW